MLLVPAADRYSPPPPQEAAFRWNRDEFFAELESRFDAARARSCRELQPELQQRRARLSTLLRTISADPAPPRHLQELLEEVLATGPLLAACPDELTWFAPFQAELRAVVKRRVGEDPRSLVYQLLYGSRAVLEEAQLQGPPPDPDVVQYGSQVPSETPSLEVHGVTLHSGDILLSRGGAPTSALIARGNDFPGNFSHVALVHIDDGQLSIVEAHIESGVQISSAEDYLADRKLRVLALRPSADLPELQKDPMLPHKAATTALERARAAHIPYDFAMDVSDSSKLFCSEVASSAYAAFGVELWSQQSTMSDPGLRAWLGSLGVRNFKTQAPSDLEYDPALVVVAEWRNPEALFDAHVDNAVIEALLDNVSVPAPLPYSIAGLPLVRVAKAYSAFINTLGLVGPVPEGMTATEAARVQYFSRYHEKVRQALLARAQSFEQDKGYRAPYWRLVEIADELVRRDPL